MDLFPYNNKMSRHKYSLMSLSLASYARQTNHETSVRKIVL